MRGKDGGQDAVRVNFGITPAYAGKRAPDTSSRLEGQDHPRVCGEKLWRRWRRTWQRGSPPRMRGKAFSVSQAHNDGGITPAYAGKSHAGVCGDLVEEDHPRVCGEKPCAQCAKTDKAGSPPRMRGKVQKLSTLRSCKRITPAYAGKRSWRRKPPVSGRDHPRVCGEKQSLERISENMPGSPPRMRGKARASSWPPAASRITPAYAGKRYCYSLSQVVDWDHPRVCGEKSALALVRQSPVGSPPRMRGKD